MPENPLGVSAQNESLKEIYDRITQYENPEQLFGNDLGADKDVQIQTLQEAYRSLIQRFHPDHHHSSAKNKYMAEEITKMILNFRARAERKIEQCTYGKAQDPNAKAESGCIIKTSRRNYTIIRYLVQGQHSDLYLAEYEDPHDIVQPFKKVVFKVVSDKNDNHLLEKETEVLEQIKHHSMPILLDHLIMPRDTEYGGKRAVFLRFIQGYDLYEIREKHPEGLNQEHVCWIMQRLLGALSFLHLNMILHNYIVPDNILVWQEIHNAFLLGFSNCLIDPQPSQRVKVVRPEFTALEIIAGGKPHPSGDMYMLGKCMVHLLGGEEGSDIIPDRVDYRIAEFIREFLDKEPLDRTNDAGNAFYELSDIREKVFGARHNHTLTFEM